MVNQYETNLDELRYRIAEYRVDPAAVADAIVRRRWSLAIAAESTPRSPGTNRRRTRAHVSCVTRRGSRNRIQALAA